MGRGEKALGFLAGMNRGEAIARALEGKSNGSTSIPSVSSSKYPGLFGAADRPLRFLLKKKKVLCLILNWVSNYGLLWIIPQNLLSFLVGAKDCLATTSQTVILVWT